MNFPLIANIVVFVVLLFALAQTRHKQWSLAKKVLVGLVMGVVFGLALHTIYGSDSQVLKDSVQWFNIVGNGYSTAANDRYAVSLRLYSERGCPSA